LWCAGGAVVFYNASRSVERTLAQERERRMKRFLASVTLAIATTIAYIAALSGLIQALICAEIKEKKNA
jgi:hypothetical protein